MSQNKYKRKRHFKIFEEKKDSNKYEYLICTLYILSQVVANKEFLFKISPTGMYPAESFISLFQVIHFKKLLKMILISCPRLCFSLESSHPILIRFTM